MTKMKLSNFQPSILIQNILSFYSHFERSETHNACNKCIPYKNHVSYFIYVTSLFIKPKLGEHETVLSRRAKFFSLQIIASLF